MWNMLLLTRMFINVFSMDCSLFGGYIPLYICVYIKISTDGIAGYHKICINCVLLIGVCVCIKISSLFNWWHCWFP